MFVAASVLAGAALAVPEARMWRSRNGVGVAATFQKLEGANVVLVRTDGGVVRVRLADLSAEDVAYVERATHVPRVLHVLYRADSFGQYARAGGEAVLPVPGDTLLFRVDDVALKGAAGAARDDLYWKLESVDVLGSRMFPQEGRPGTELATEGKYVFVMYQVKNASPEPLVFPAPLLYDQKGRRFSQLLDVQPQDYIPPNSFCAGVTTLQPGMGRLFCAYYEVPADAVPAAVEAFPSVMMAGAVNREYGIVAEPKGVRFFVNKAAAMALAPPAAPAAGEGMAAAVSMTCAQVTEANDSESWLYDRSKKRAVTYGVELRGGGARAQAVKVKAYFIGKRKNGRDVMVGLREAEALVEPEKAVRLTAQFDEDELAGQMFQSARVERRLKGVVIQAWTEKGIVAAWASQEALRRYAHAADVAQAVEKAR